MLAVLAALRHMVLMTSATNDNFLHMTLAQQLLAGDWPVRDFFEGGWLLQYSLSAVAQLIVGDRLLAEALIVGIAWACSTYIVFRVVQHVSGSGIAATIAGTLLILAAARGYSYPKAIVYAVAAMLWWSYVRDPTRAKLAGLGAWGAVAFYWRPDHGVYVAVGIALAAWAAHDFGRAWLTACAFAGSVMLALVVPFFAYVHAIFGLGNYVQTGVAAARSEHLANGPHVWPVLRFAGNIFTVEPADHYAPIIGIRWSPSSSSDARSHVLAAYHLTLVETDGDSVRVRLSQHALDRLGALINEPSVEDTAGIERAAGALLPSAWPDEKRRAFDQPWRRMLILPDLEGQARAAEFIVALFYLLPVVMAAVAPLMARRLPGTIGVRAIVAFAAFAFVVDFAMLRLEFSARVFDAVVLPAIVFGCCFAWTWRATSTLAGGTPIRVGAMAFTAVLMAGVTRAGQFTNPLSWAGSVPELVSSPPLQYYVDRRARFPLRLAAYVRACVPPSDRLVVLWFEPEIFYYSERLMAQQHLVFAPAWAGLAHEQNSAMQKMKRYSAPIVLARSSALEDSVGATYPGLITYLESEYLLAATVDDQGERYMILSRRDRPALRGFGAQNWPCFIRDRSPWERVGQSN
jgi:hypothetical protein